MFDKNFVEFNGKFWARFREPETDNLLLVETCDHPVINHSNAVAAKMVANAKGLRIAWIENKLTDKELMLSYSSNSIFIKFKHPSFFTKLRFLFMSIFYYLSHALLINRIHSFKYKGIPYGDFIYDGYLAFFSMATLHRFDARMIKVFYNLLVHDQQARALLSQHGNIKGVLVTHYIGTELGPLSRVTMQQNIPLYWKGGGHEIFCLSVFNNLKEVYDYPLTPSLYTVDLLENKFSEQVKTDFEDFINRVNNPYYGSFSVAYNNVIVSDMTRGQFLKEMKLEDKPLIFVMLHAFNDFPHSHFKKMLFKDYYDWFFQTFKFAVQDKSKNWIFKEHPANEFYPTRDVDLNRIFRRVPGHIRFVSSKSNVNAATVLNVADAIITCIGTAGVEMSALRGIPSVIAGDSFFDGFGFTIEPKSKKEYFETLQNLFLGKLTPRQQLRAKCCYLYVRKYTSVPFAGGPPLTYKESKEPHKLREFYPGRILDCYKKNSDLIYKQFDQYVGEIKKPGFKRLLRFAIKETT